MTKILKTLLIAAILSSSSAFAQDMLKVSLQQDGSQRVDFTLNGNTACVLIDDKITCAPQKLREPMKLAATDTN